VDIAVGVTLGIADGMVLLDNMVVDEAAFDEKKFLKKIK